MRLKPATRHQSQDDPADYERVVAPEPERLDQT
jgi:hypothetical protein